MSCPTVVGVSELPASCDGANAFAAQLTLSDITLFISLEEVSFQLCIRPRHGWLAGKVLPGGLDDSSIQSCTCRLKIILHVHPSTIQDWPDCPLQEQLSVVASGVLPHSGQVAPVQQLQQQRAAAPHAQAVAATNLRKWGDHAAGRAGPPTRQTRRVPAFGVAPSCWGLHVDLMKSRPHSASHRCALRHALFLAHEVACS